MAHKLVKRLVSVVTYVLLAVIVLAIVFLFVSRAKNKLVFVGSYSVVWVKTDSMEPTIPAQTYIVVRKAAGDAVKEGDVITFYSDDPSLSGALNTHRVVAETEDGFITKGDHNYVEDKTPAQKDKVVGTYVRNLTFLSGIGRFMAKPAGLFVIVLGFLAIILLLYLPEIVKGLKKKEKPAELSFDERVQAEVEKLKSQNQSVNGGENDVPKDET